MADFRRFGVKGGRVIHKPFQTKSAASVVEGVFLRGGNKRVPNNNCRRFLVTFFINRNLSTLSVRAPPGEAEIKRGGRKSIALPMRLTHVGQIIDYLSPLDDLDLSRKICMI